MSKLLFLCGSCLVMTIMLVAQAPPTIKDALAAKHVDASSISALRGALKNPDPSVRSMAAMEIASERLEAEAPLIETALGREDNVDARVAIARALVVLNDPTGVLELQRICSAKEMRIDLRILAASSFHPASYDCTKAIALRFSETTSSAEMVTELHYLIKTGAQGGASPELLSLLLTGAESALKSDLAVVRRQAADLIVAYHLSDALPSLREAAKRESDVEVSKNLENAIALLTEAPS